MSESLSREGSGNAGVRPEVSATPTEDRRRFLAKMANYTGASLMWLSFPGAARQLAGQQAANLDSLPALSDMEGAMPASNFPQCDPFGEYSNGKDCESAYACQLQGFQCEGSALDDFECSSTFACPTTFVCTYSFDSEDCETFFTCKPDAFACEADYN